MPYVSAPSDVARDHAAKRLASPATPRGAIAAVPLLRSAASVLRDVAPLSELS